MIITLYFFPPSGAVAGAYSTTDNSIGIWNAPANLSLFSVIDPVIKIDNAHQDDLIVDPDAGKSINVIRTFAGRGVVVWGARTLAGNDNEWKYISVRRFVTMVEVAIKRLANCSVFEPNTVNTWKKVSRMIDTYLSQKWKEGGLAGSTVNEAFFVKCGLGITMTGQDVLDGNMIIEIGIAAVRPAEFIIITFSQKLQTS